LPGEREAKLREVQEGKKAKRGDGRMRNPGKGKLTNSGGVGRTRIAQGQKIQNRVESNGRKKSYRGGRKRNAWNPGAIVRAL